MLSWASPAALCGQPLILTVCGRSILTWHHCGCQVGAEERGAGQEWQAYLSSPERTVHCSQFSPDFFKDTWIILFSDIASKARARCLCVRAQCAPGRLSNVCVYLNYVRHCWHQVSDDCMWGPWNLAVSKGAKLVFGQSGGCFKRLSINFIVMSPQLRKVCSAS